MRPRSSVRFLARGFYPEACRPHPCPEGSRAPRLVTRSWSLRLAPRLHGPRRGALSLRREVFHCRREIFPHWQAVLWSVALERDAS